MGMRVGVIGGGQLARMMLPPAIELGIELSVFAQTVGSSAKPANCVVGDFRNADEVLGFAREVDVVTFDHESVPLDVLAELLDAGVIVRPGPKALSNAQDKTVMRRNLSDLGIAIPRWSVASTVVEVDDFRAGGASSRVVAKTPTGGYDGKGVRVVTAGIEVSDWLEQGEVLLEDFVPFTREVAQLLARRPSGGIAVWPLVETRQKNGVCAEVLAPAPDSGALAAPAEGIARRIAEGLDVHGVLAVEMFETMDGKLIVNELAMRPHNSGHVFTELSNTSQFEQHLRAVLDWPLGDPSLRARSGVMVNIFGGVDTGKVAEALGVGAAVKIHDYGKQARPGRKAGHVSIVGDDSPRLIGVAREAAAVCETGEFTGPDGKS